MDKETFLKLLKKGENKTYTDHDRCIQIILDYITSSPIFQIIDGPNYGGGQGPDLVFRNTTTRVVEYIEVELDAKVSKKARRIAKRAEEYSQKFEKARLWMVSSSDKWLTSEKGTGVIDYLDKSLLKTGKIEVNRISPIDLGVCSITRNFPFR
ncbi:MAG: hypothetical protein QXQ94_09660 [Candidatus Bathyarchaeia archaeon]